MFPSLSILTFYPMGPGAVSEPGRRGQIPVIRHWSRHATKQVRGFPREPQILPRGLDFRSCESSSNVRRRGELPTWRQVESGPDQPRRSRKQRRAAAVIPQRAPLKSSTVKSSTMNGPIAYGRKGLPVSCLGDVAEKAARGRKRTKAVANDCD